MACLCGCLFNAQYLIPGHQLFDCSQSLLEKSYRFCVFDRFCKRYHFIVKGVVNAFSPRAMRRAIKSRARRMSLGS